MQQDVKRSALGGGKAQSIGRAKNTQIGGSGAFRVFNYTFFALLAVLMVYPFWHVIMLSLSNTRLASSGGIFLWPRGATLSTYRSVLRNKDIISGFGVSTIVTVGGTVAGTLITALTAYPLSKAKLRGGPLMMFLVLFTMLFNAGMVPYYLLLKDLKMLNTLYALIVPSLVSAYNVIIMRSFFASLPASLEESAKIDGANDAYIFFRIILPLSMATVATIALFTAVGYWNDYLSTVIYINDRAKWSLQANLRNLLTNTSKAMRESGIEVNTSMTTSEETIKAASIVVSTVPILVVYPFLQRYFVKGVMVGAIKG